MKIKPSLFTFIVSLSILSFPLYSQIQNPRNVKYDWKTDTTIKTVDLSEIIMVLPRGAFPKIDYPVFIGREEGEKSFFKHEPVIAIEIKGKAKAYPLSMLTMHEISNDTLSGIPILPTY